MKNNNLIITSIIGLFIIISSISGIIGSNIYNILTQNNNVVDNINNNQKSDIKNINTEIKNINITDLQNEITKIVEDVSPGVVSIIIKKDLLVYRNSRFGLFGNPIGSVERKVGGGTGFFITKDGMIITNKHVISDNNATYTVITYDNKEYDAKVIASDPNNDLAILKIIDETKEFTTLDFVNSPDEINIGQFAIAVGNALAEFQNSVSLGVISGKNRNINDGVNNIGGLIQTDAAINPGNSGGPLINLDGKVMGINTAIIQGAEGLGFSISLTKNKVDYILDSINKYGVIKRPYIGISYIPLSETIKQEYNLLSSEGLYVVNEQGAIIPGSPAEKSGIKPGDIITKINGKKITGSSDLNQIIQNKFPGNTINLTILRKGEDKELNIEVILGEI